MFNKNDPLVNAVTGVMKENEVRRQVEQKLCEELGIYSRKALPREHHANYDALLEQRISEALHPNQQKLDVHEPEKDKLTAQDFKMLRAGKKNKEMSEAELAGPETGPRKTAGSNQPMCEEDMLKSRGGIAAVNRKPREGRGESDIAAGNRSDSKRPYTDDDTKRVRSDLKGKIKAALGKHKKANLPEEMQDMHSNQPNNLNNLKRDMKSVPNDSQKTTSPDESPIVNKPAKSFAEEMQNMHSNQPNNLSNLKKDLQSAPDDSQKTTSPDESPIVSKPAKSFSEEKKDKNKEAYEQIQKGKEERKRLIKSLRAKKKMNEEEGEETREGGAVRYNGKPVVSPTATRAGESSASRPASEGPSQRERSALTNMIKNIKEEQLNEKATEAQRSKVEKVMREFKKRKLHSGSKEGPMVTNPKQAIAIALNQAGLSKNNGDKND